MSIETVWKRLTVPGNLSPQNVRTIVSSRKTEALASVISFFLSFFFFLFCCFFFERGKWNTAKYLGREFNYGHCPSRNGLLATALNVVLISAFVTQKCCKFWKPESPVYFTEDHRAMNLTYRITKFHKFFQRLESMCIGHDALSAKMANNEQRCQQRFLFTARFNNMRTLKFKAQPTNAFFTTVNQVLGGSSHLPTTTERAVINSALSKVQTTKQYSVVVGSWKEPPNIWLTVAKKRICRLSFEF